MNDVAIRVEHLSKRYRIGSRQLYRTFRETITNILTAPLRRLRPDDTQDAEREFLALNDVSFEVNRGEVIGIIGRNGAGKSTLLKILSRITEPTSGRVEINGRVGSLLEVGTGFHAELTGRENVYLNGAILGMKRAEIAAKFDEIVAFAEVDQFLDTPVKHYSSGMYVRLAFAVAAHLEPEILIVDEVLAVGDVAFQKKCMGRMGEVAEAGRTVLFVSHNLPAVRNLCRTALLLDAGAVKRIGPSEEVVDQFIKGVSEVIVTVPLAERTDRTGSGKIRLIDFWVEDREGNRVDHVASGMDIYLTFKLAARESELSRSFDVGFSFHRADGEMLTVLYSSYSAHYYQAAALVGTYRCHISRLPLNFGRYGIGARIVMGTEECDWPRDGIGFLDVELGDYYRTGSRGFESTTPSNATPFLLTGEWSQGDAREGRGSCR